LDSYDDCDNLFDLYPARNNAFGFLDRPTGRPGFGTLERIHQTADFNIDLADKYPDSGLVHIGHKCRNHSDGFRNRAGIQCRRILVRAAFQYRAFDNPLFDPLDRIDPQAKLTGTGHKPVFGC